MLVPTLFKGLLGAPNTFVRFLNAAPESAAVDVYINDKLAFKNIHFTKFSRFVQLPVGRYNLSIFQAGQNTNPLIEQQLGIVHVPWSTIALTGTGTNLRLIVIPGGTDDHSPCSIRLVQLAPHLNSVDLNLTNQARLFSNVSFKEITYYVPVFPGSYSFTINSTGSAAPLLTSTIKVRSDRCCTVYLLGANNNSLQAIVST